MMLQGCQLEQVVMETAKWHTQDSSFCLFFPRFSSQSNFLLFAGGVKFNDGYIRCSSFVSSCSVLSALKWGASGATCVSQADNLCRKLHAPPLQWMENRFINSSSSLCSIHSSNWGVSIFINILAEFLRLSCLNYRALFQSKPQLTFIIWS